MRLFLFILFINVLLYNLGYPQIKSPKRELRGAWIATVANIDWPTNKSASSGEKITELIMVLDKLKECGINTVFFQIRTECDALYNSTIEPWSYWLTGEQGKAPDPYFDPLEFAVSEAHKRGMELHAWFNPYRAVKDVDGYPAAPGHVSVLHPDWILKFGKFEMLDPGIPDVTNFILSVVSDVLRRYNIDGIHFDDYFYPYGPKISNEDSLTFSKYKGDFTNIDDWRRNNINNLMAKISDTIKVIKPKVKFGISPFGIVENKYAGTKGFESYRIIYCDPLNWIKNKIVDYVAPQLYWEIGYPKADYAALLKWWASAAKNCQLYIGQYSSVMAAPDYKGSKYEMLKQINLNRNTGNVQGEIFFSAKSIVYNYSGLFDSLKNYYRYPALIPSMEWKDNTPPNSPINLKTIKDSTAIFLTWDSSEKASDGDTAEHYVIYRFNQGQEVNLELSQNIIYVTPNNITSFKDYSVPVDGKYTYAVTSLDKLNNESKTPAVLIMK